MAMRQPRTPRTASDEALVRTLYEQHGAALLAYATRLTGDRPTAEDILQETLIRAWRHAGELSEAVGSIRGWLFTVARNIVTDKQRARGARPVEVAQSPDTEPVERDHADRVVDSIVAMEALELLSEDHRRVLVHLYLEGHSVAETAEALGIPPGTVKSRTHNAMKNLQQRLVGRTVAQGVAG